jgi:hypothetical protein
LLEVELVQLEHTALVRCLIKHHGLRSVLTEGLTPKAVPNFWEVIAALRDMDRSLTKLMKQRDELRQKDDAIEQGIAELQKELRDRLVPYGTPGRLALAEEVAVLPLDDDELLDKANPVRPDGKVKPELARTEARHDAQVAAALKSGTSSLLILGGSHDLSASVRRFGGTVDYVRVTTTRFKEVAKSR